MTAHSHEGRSAGTFPVLMIFRFRRSASRESGLGPDDMAGFCASDISVYTQIIFQNNIEINFDELQKQLSEFDLYYSLDILDYF